VLYSGVNERRPVSVPAPPVTSSGRLEREFEHVHDYEYQYVYEYAERERERERERVRTLALALTQALELTLALPLTLPLTQALALPLLKKSRPVVGGGETYDRARATGGFLGGSTGKFGFLMS